MKRKFLKWILSFFSFSIFCLKTTKVLFMIVKNYRKKISSSIRYKIKRPDSPLSIRRLGLYEITIWTSFSDVVTGAIFSLRQRNQKVLRY